MSIHPPYTFLSAEEIRYDLTTDLGAGPGVWSLDRDDATGGLKEAVLTPWSSSIDDVEQCLRHSYLWFESGLGRTFEKDTYCALMLPVGGGGLISASRWVTLFATSLRHVFKIWLCSTGSDDSYTWSNPPPRVPAYSIDVLDCEILSNIPNDSYPYNAQFSYSAASYRDSGSVQGEQPFIIAFMIPAGTTCGGVELGGELEINLYAAYTGWATGVTVAGFDSYVTETDEEGPWKGEGFDARLFLMEAEEGKLRCQSQ